MRQTNKTKAMLVIALMVVGYACGDSFSYDSASYFSEQWESSYTKKKSCAKSPTHGSEYVEVWVSPEALEAYEDRSKPMPTGAVILKPQFKDDKCEDRAAWTAMRKKDSSDSDPTVWDWQRVEGDGSVTSSGKSDFCNSCHTACPGGICSAP